MASPILQTVRLGAPPWPTVDPFLFCVHHVDAYPAGNLHLGPDADLRGRSIGQDFSATDGWNMYHGSVVPGFPSHPHRGFETITYVRRGLVDHADSLGAAARYGKGDVQWMTAGRGIQHAEMFPLLDPDGPNPMELFQIWLNLPAEDKMVEPSYKMLWDDEIPRVPVEGEGEITVIAGAIPGPSGLVVPPSPAPDSWAARADTDVALWHVRLGAGGSTVLPPARFPDTARVLYVFDGDGLSVAGSEHDVPTGIVVDAAQEVPLAAVGGGVDVLVMQGRPIGEPVAQYGPFVMNTKAEIQQAFEDYQRDHFGGWPWDRPDPVHGRDPQRFARHADGREELAS
ncbi:MAG TPA: pirin family protein [Acidimicrobiales bacterium]|nr:pirin family protein [Acidimicrobiales bacterium]